jgi:hypothetical protein
MDDLVAALGATKDFRPPATQALQEASSDRTEASPATTHPGHGAYVFYFNSLAHQSQWSSTNPAVAFASGGVFNGMRWGEAQNKAQQLWEALSPQEQMAYAQKAEKFGSGPDPAKIENTDNSMNINITHDPNQ